MTSVEAGSLLSDVLCDLGQQVSRQTLSSLQCAALACQCFLSFVQVAISPAMLQSFGFCEEVMREGFFAPLTTISHSQQEQNARFLEAITSQLPVRRWVIFATIDRHEQDFGECRWKLSPRTRLGINKTALKGCRDRWKTALTVVLKTTADSESCVCLCLSLIPVSFLLCFIYYTHC